LEPAARETPTEISPGTSEEEAEEAEAAAEEGEGVAVASEEAGEAAAAPAMVSEKGASLTDAESSTRSAWGEVQGGKAAV
jgi:hypothetical protein